MEPLDVIQTEIPEDLLRDILIRTYPKKFLAFQVIMNFMLFICGAYVISMVIYVYFKYDFLILDLRDLQYWALVFFYGVVFG